MLTLPQSCLENYIKLVMLAKTIEPAAWKIVNSCKHRIAVQNITEVN